MILMLCFVSYNCTSHTNHIWYFRNNYLMRCYIHSACNKIKPGIVVFRLLQNDAFVSINFLLNLLHLSVIITVLKMKELNIKGPYWKYDWNQLHVSSSMSLFLILRQIVDYDYPLYNSQTQ